MGWHFLGPQTRIALLMIRRKRTKFSLWCLFLTLLVCLSSVAGADDAAVESLKEVGGLALPMPNGGWEVEFHLRGRDLTTDDALKRLSLLPEVVSVNLRDTRVSSAGLVHLKKLGSLRRLHLERTRVDDAGVAHLSGLSQLEYLNLYDTDVTDKALEHLTGLKNLKQLYLWKTKVTKVGAEKLQKTLPELRISRGVDLEKLVALKKPEPKREVEVLTWIPSTEKKPPKSTPGTFIEVNFRNSRSERIKLYWVDYGGGLKLYVEIDPGGVRRQTTYSGASWLVRDMKEKSLGYFRTGQKYATAVIP